MNTDTRRRRYPGVRAFEEADVALFYGRQAAAEQLLLRVLSVRLLLQFAPSGVGKTSLLQAGLFPKLRGHDCFPCIVRLNRREESLVDATRRSLLEAASRFGLRDPVVPAEAADLPALLARTQLWSEEPALLTPVLAFDQFEEVFTLRDEAFRQDFARQIGALVGARPAGDAAAPPVKIIISLREEFLGRLEQFSHDIPELFAERLRLPPLNRDEARAAIVEPAALQDAQWRSPPFGYLPDCVDSLLDFIDGTSGLSPVVEPLTLQLVCSHAEDLALKAQQDGRPLHPLALIDFHGVDGLRRLVADHYRRELERLPRAQRRHAREMFEHGLLDPAGKRLMLEEGEIERDHGLKRESLDELVTGHLLRREPRNESLFYEIGHDRLAEAIARQRRIRLPRWLKRTLGGAALAFCVLLVIGLVVGQEKLSTYEALEKADRTLDVMLADDLVARLRDVGETEALRAAIGRIDRAEPVPTVDNAGLLLRLQGDIAEQRRRLDEAREHFDRAYTFLGPEPGPGDPLRESAATRAERARLLARLARLDADEGLTLQARARYEKSAALWSELLAGTPSLLERLDATEAMSYLAELAMNQFDHAAAELWFTKALDSAVTAWLEASGSRGDVDRDRRFEQARALYLLADVMVVRAMLWSDRQMGRAANALAQEARRLRPQSAETVRKQVVTAAFLGSHGGAAPTPEVPPALLQSIAQLDDLTRMDPADLTARRNRAALSMLVVQQQSACLADPKCARGVPAARRARLQDELLDALGDMRWLASQVPSDLGWQSDVGWALSVQAQLQQALGQAEAADRSLAQAIEAYDAVRGTEPAPDRIATVESLLVQRAEGLARLGRGDDAIALLAQADRRQALLTAPQREGNWHVWAMLRARAEVMDALGRSADAQDLRRRAQEHADRLGRPWEAAAARATEAEERGIDLLGRANDPARRLPTLDQATEAVQAFRAAVLARPFEARLWDHLRNAYRWQAELLKGQTDPVALQRRLGTGAAALGAGTVAMVLADAMGGADYHWQRYESRRLLALIYRDSGRRELADALTREGVLETRTAIAGVDAVETTRQLIQLRDAYHMQGLTRHDGRRPGWLEPARLGLAYAERVAQREPGNAGHLAWLGQARLDLARRLRESGQPEPAGVEVDAAAQACRRGLELAPSPEHRQWLQECLSAAEAAPR